MDAHTDNPWTGATLSALRDRGLLGDPEREGPHMFAWREPQTITTALDDAGFFDATVEQVDLLFEYPASTTGGMPASICRPISRRRSAS